MRILLLLSIIALLSLIPASAYATSDQFITVWETTESDETITINTLAHNSPYTIDWGDGIIDIGVITDRSHIYAEAGLHTVSISGDLSEIHFQYLPSILKLVDIKQWGDSTWNKLHFAFQNVINMEMSATDVPDISDTLDLSFMFKNAASFNGDISNWDVSHIQNMDSMFEGATSFNADISGWDVSSISSSKMSKMLDGATSFNQNLGKWYVILDNDIVHLNAVNLKIGNIASQNSFLDGQVTLYSLPSGYGDNNSFTISNNELYINNTPVKNTQSEYSIRIEVQGSDWGFNNSRDYTISVIEPEIVIEILEFTENSILLNLGATSLDENNVYNINYYMHTGVSPPPEGYMDFVGILPGTSQMIYPLTGGSSYMFQQQYRELDPDEEYTVVVGIRDLSILENVGLEYTSFTLSELLFEEPVPLPEEPITSPEEPPKRGGGGCNDCTPPTLGLDENMMRVVDNGFSYNGNDIQVEYYHTPYPLITATVGELNKVELIVYENGGISNMEMIQFGLGAAEIGEPLNDLEVLIEVHLLTDGTSTGISVDEIVIIDRDNLIDSNSVTADSYVIECQDGDTDKNCVKVDLEYSYRESTINNIMVVNTMDKKRNTETFYFNDGIQVLGDSINIPPTQIINNKHITQQKDNLTLTLTRIDRADNIWIDDNQNQWHKNNSGTFIQLTFSEILYQTDKSTNIMTRTHSAFGNVIIMEQDKAKVIFDSTKIQSGITSSFAYDYPSDDDRLEYQEFIIQQSYLEELKAQELLSQNWIIIRDKWSIND